MTLRDWAERLGIDAAVARHNREDFGLRVFDDVDDVESLTIEEALSLAALLRAAADAADALGRISDGTHRSVLVEGHGVRCLGACPACIARAALAALHAAEGL